MGPDNKPLPAGSVLVWQDERRNTFLFLAPDSGYYALVLFEAGRPVGQFLVDASSEAKDSGCFPLPDWGRVGVIGFTVTSVTSVGGGGGRWLTPLSHPMPYVRTEEAELAMRFGFEGDADGSGGDGGVELKAELLSVGADGGAEAAGNFALVCGVQGNGSGGGYDIRCRFPRAGHYLLRLLVRNGGSGDWQLYFTYFVRAVGHVDGSAAEFPVLTSAWRSGGALLEPLERTLPLDRPTPVRLRLADSTVTAVSAVGTVTGRRVPFNRNSDDPQLWVGVVSIGEFDKNENCNSEGCEGEVDDYKRSKISSRSNIGTGGVTLVARTESGSEEELVNFEFESEGTGETKLAAMRRAAALNKQRQSAEATRQLKQENRRRRDQGLEPLKDPAKVAADEAAAVEAAARAKAAKAEAAAKAAARAEEAAVKADLMLHIAQLDAALLERNLAGVRKAIEALAPFSAELRGRDANKLVEARLTLTALQHRKSLRDALSEAKRTRNTQRLRALLHSLEDAEPQLPEAQLAIFKEDLRLAKAEIERDDRLKRKPEHKLDMNPKSLSELRQYSRPVESVHRTVQALLLLLGFYEKLTRKWLRCQPLLKSITTTVVDFDPRTVHPRIAARSRQILDGIDKREIALQSAAAFAFYEWAVKITQSIKEAAPKETFVPATIKQQMRILDVTREEDAVLDFEDEGIRRSMSVIIH